MELCIYTVVQTYEYLIFYNHMNYMHSLVKLIIGLHTKGYNAYPWCTKNLPSRFSS